MPHLEGETVIYSRRGLALLRSESPPRLVISRLFKSEPNVTRDTVTASSSSSFNKHSCAAAPDESQPLETTLSDRTGVNERLLPENRKADESAIEESTIILPNCRHRFFFPSLFFSVSGDRIRTHTTL